VDWDEDLIADQNTRDQAMDVAMNAVASIEQNNPGAGLGLVNQSLRGN